MTELGRNMSSN